jgi:elongation factor 2
MFPVTIPSLGTKHSKDKFYAFGHVFSGTIRVGSKVRLQGPDYLPRCLYFSAKNDLNAHSVEGMVHIKGPLTSSAGDLVGIASFDWFLLSSGTITSSETAYKFKIMKNKLSGIQPEGIGFLPSYFS